MITRESVADWLDKYVRAWKSYDPEAIGDLFSQDAEYYYGPYREPVRGRWAIVADWLAPDHKDEAGTYDGVYEPVAVDGDVAVANGRSTYYTPGRGDIAAQYDNIFVMRFDNDGRCVKFQEWFMERPRPKKED